MCESNVIVDDFWVDPTDVLSPAEILAAAAEAADMGRRLIPFERRLRAMAGTAMAEAGEA